MAKAPPQDLEALDSVINSLAKAIVALNDGQELTPEQIAAFKQAAVAEGTWNPLKQNDLVPVAEILEMEDFEEEPLEGAATKMVKANWSRPLSTSERVMLQDLDEKLTVIARQLIAKAKDGVTVDSLNLGDSPWEKLARRLIQETAQLVASQQAV